MGIRKSIFTFAGQASSDYFLTVEYIPNYTAAARSIETYTVPGRSGDLIYDTGDFSNVVQMYEVWYKAPIRAHQAARGILNWLTGVRGYQRLEDTYDPDIYRMAYFANETEFETWFYKCGRGTLEFNCMPQRYLKSGEFALDIENGQSLYNSWQPAKPLIVLTGSGVGTVCIGDYTIGISSIPSSGMTIDCDTQNAYDGLNNYNNLITVPNGFPVLERGENTISFEGVQTLKITPRWWCI